MDLNDMNLPGARTRRCDGLTLIELMIAMVIGLLAMAALYRTYTFQDKVQNQQERLMEANQNARNAMDVLTRDLRMAGLGVPSGVQKITAATYQSITFLVNYWDVSTTLSAQAASGATSLTVNSITGFESGQTIYISDGTNYESKTLATNPSGSTITLPSALTTSFPRGSTVSVAGSVVFQFAGSPKQIQRNLYGAGDEVLASDIDYMQIKYYDSSGTQVSSIGSTLTSAERDTVRSVKILIAARTSKQETATATVTYEDGSSTTDGYKRIYLESDIGLRNTF